MPLPFELGKVYTFNTLAPALLGATIDNAKLISILDYETATNSQNFLKNTYSNILPNLPDGTPSDPNLSDYYVFKRQSGDKIVLSQYWIDIETIEEIELINIKVDITDVSSSKIELVRNLLLAAGITTFNITQV